MTEQQGNVNYNGMFGSGSDHKFGVTENVGGVDVIFDETIGAWVYLANRSILWKGATPEVAPVETPVTTPAEPPVETPVAVPAEPTVETPLTIPAGTPVIPPVEVPTSNGNIEKFVAIKTTDVGKVRLRAAASTDSEVLGFLFNGEVLHVLSDDNPEWVFAETLKDNVYVQGYVMRTFIVETSSQSVS